eukprot:CAMPEP_0178985672 /NCGR_PEP_ID=MMETSP0795-20121207/2279_1 /TAXON_ID=88552 /ORGANISM="Amoebophrya sp., Strain Ameob2" /LENGTH=976 /DNA_ID=CAMNT_0020676649 /DNA_START=96 /DNA_END=3026 /DNA_ORIENTATION=+
MTVAAAGPADLAPGAAKPKVFYRKDYRPPPYWIRHVDLDINLLSPSRTEVRATLTMCKNTTAGGKRPAPVVFDCDEMLNVEEVACAVVGTTPSEPSSKILAPKVDYAFSGAGEARKLEILEDRIGAASSVDLDSGSEFLLKTKCSFNPTENKTCMGLYTTKLADDSVLYCTQMEAEGFRKLTPFFDRPDVMSKYRVKITADKTDCPVLLGNGNCVESGDVIKGGACQRRHYAVFEDPHVKPCYLFACVAGRLSFIEEQFETRGASPLVEKTNKALGIKASSSAPGSSEAAKKKVTLRVYAEKAVAHLLQHSMDSLRRAMEFDENYFNLEYDLSVFNIVSVKDFNMGAMENKSLNIFNEKLILANRDTATDADFERIESVVAHEYFHNWSGNRVTCRDWFQLTLKEGLTVFRDQVFSTKVGLFNVSKRIDQVRDVVESQFLEDSGSLSHPVRPEFYEKIDNFYTATVYEKGAEVIRMYMTILGEEGFKKGLMKYFQTHDGTAATCDDFLKAMEDANAFDLSLFSKWLSTKGTPELKVEKKHYRGGVATSGSDGTGGRFELVFTQGLGDVTEVLHIPIAYGLVDAKTGKEITSTKVYHLKEKEGTEVIEIPAGVLYEDVVPSLNRGFGAPVKLKYDYSDAELSALAAFDTDMYTKYHAFDSLATRAIHAAYDSYASPASCVGAAGNKSFDALEDSLMSLLKDRKSPSIVVGKTLALPDVAALMMSYSGGKCDPLKMLKAVVSVREKLVAKVGAAMKERYLGTPQLEGADGSFSLSQEAIGNRLLRNTLLILLKDAKLAYEQYFSAKTFTDKVAAARVLIETGSFEKVGASSPLSPKQDFYEFAERSKSGPVMDKWFALQSMFASDISTAKALVKHPEFTISNPNRFRSVVFSLTHNANQLFFTDEGREFAKEQILALDAYGNGQLAARQSRAFEVCSQVSEKYAEKIYKTMEEMLSVKAELKAETKEILNKILEGREK